MARTKHRNSRQSGLLAVERALHETYLAIGDGDRSPLVCIDVTPERLGPVLVGLGPADETHLAVLARACGTASEALSVFEHGPSRLYWQNPQTSGLLRYLVLACVLLARPEDAAGDGTDARRNFRANLGRVFGRVAAPPIEGLPALWNELARWSTVKAAADGNVRRVVLSLNESVRGGTYAWRHLGTTYRMTLPSWRDEGKFETLLRRNPALFEGAHPADLARELPGMLLGAARFSRPFREAAESFVELHERRASLLGHHRFWHVFEATVARVRVVPGGALREARHRMRLLLGQDVLVELLSGATGSAERLAADHAVALLRGRMDGARPGAFSARLRTMADVGAFAFRRTGLGTGEVEPLEETPDDGPAWLLLADSHRTRAQALGVALRQASAGWWLSEPVDAGTAAALAAAVGLESGHLAREPAERIQLEDGLRIGTRNWLGLPEFLPAARAGTDADVSVEQEDIRFVREGDLWRLRADAPIEGERTVTVEERDGTGHAAIAVRGKIRFLTEAVPHTQLGAPSDDGRWESGNGTRAGTDAAASAPDAPVPDVQPYLPEPSLGNDPFARLLEAIYAGGRSGWSEGALLGLLRRSPAAIGRSGFGLLAALEEAGWLVSARTVGWRARRWWLAEPALSSPDGDPLLSVLRGSAPQAIRRRFAGTARALGGRVLEIRHGTLSCPPTLAAIGVERDALAKETGWHVEPPSPWPAGSAPHCWIPSRDDGTKHEPVASWNWTTARFDGSPNGASSSTAATATTIERLRRERGDRHDLYRVRGGPDDPRELLTADRSVAMTEAYRMARLPFLERVEGRLAAPSDDARLPLSVARCLRRLHPFGASGPSDLRGRCRYSYPAGAAIEAALVGIYGRCFISGLQGEPSKLDPLASAAAGRVLARRGIRVGDPAHSLIAAALAPARPRSR